MAGVMPPNGGIIMYYSDSFFQAAYIFNALLNDLWLNECIMSLPSGSCRCAALHACTHTYCEELSFHGAGFSV